MTKSTESEPRNWRPVSASGKCGWAVNGETAVKMPEGEMTANSKNTSVYETARRLIGRRRFKDARRRLLGLAVKGDAEAQYLLGNMSWEGADMSQACAYRWLAKAASQGHPDACYKWACYSSSFTYKPRKTEDDNRRLRIKAARLGSVDSQFGLGVCYATGDWAGPKDSAKAAQWYAKAAHRGHAEAQYNLGMMLSDGEGIRKNTKRALYWLRQSVAGGYTYAAKVLRQLRRQQRKQRSS